ncbi:MAG: protoporphyrinogen oxidase, partial [Actinomycetota bacterium]
LELAGRPLDVGADALLVRQPEGEALVRALGFGDQDLVAPATGQVHLWTRGRLRPLPSGTVMGVPSDLRALARSRVLTPPEMVRVALEPLVPRRQVPGDRSVADLVGERVGPAVVERLVEPLLGGVYAGDARRLSAQAALPSVWAAARGHRSLLAGLRAHRAGTAADDRPVFLTLRGGLTRLVDRLAAELGERVVRSSPVQAVTARAGGWRLHLDDRVEEVDAVVLAVPPAVAAMLLADPIPDAARELAGIRTTSVGVVALAYDPADAQDAPVGSGVLVPRGEGRLVKAITITSRKWPHQAGADTFLVRASVGRVDDPAALELDDETLATRVDAEVRWALRLRAPAGQRAVVRWPHALPQYEVGHRDRVERLRFALDAPEARGLHVGGAALDGLGLAARARDARSLADAVRADLAGS